MILTIQVLIKKVLTLPSFVQRKIKIAYALWISDIYAKKKISSKYYFGKIKTHSICKSFNIIYTKRQTLSQIPTVQSSQFKQQITND